MSGVIREPFGLQRHSVFRTGLVEAQDVVTARVRVQFPDRDNMISWWLPVIVPKSQNDKLYWIPDIGEQVVVLMDEHDEYGAVVGAIFSTVDAPPNGMTSDKFHVAFKDGTTLEYDRAAHTLTANVVSGGSACVNTAKGNRLVLAADGTSLMEDAAGAYVKATNDGNVRVNGNLLVAGTISTTAGVWGDGRGMITGNLSASGEVIAGCGGGGQVGLQTHTHSGVQGGGSNTSIPNAGT